MSTTPNTPSFDASSSFVVGPPVDVPTTVPNVVVHPPVTPKSIEPAQSPTIEREPTAPTDCEHVVAPLLPDLPPKPKDARYYTLDIMRGMACLMLMLYHATFYAEHSWATGDPSTWTAGGLAINIVGRLWMGVPMFFVVSGYCIAASIDSLRRKPHSLSNYFYRRFKRIYPPLWAGFIFAIGVTLLVRLSPFIYERCLQLPRMSSFTVTDWIANFAAAASWMPKMFGEETKYLLSNTWTLCYEEQFYVVTGMLLIVSSRRFFAAAYVIAIVTLVARHVCRYCDIPIYGFFFDGHWLLFACGILLYERINYLRGKQAWMAFGVFAFGAMYGLGERVLATDPHDRHVGEYIFVACTFAIFLSMIKRWDKQIVAHWSLKPFQWFGKISYSLYLTHFPVTVLLACILGMLGVRGDGMVFLITIPLCFAISIPIALLFYHCVERHCINAPSK